MDRRNKFTIGTRFDFAGPSGLHSKDDIESGDAEFRWKYATSSISFSPVLSTSSGFEAATQLGKEKRERITTSSKGSPKVKISTKAWA
jgi:hypothetical protein